jgi:hypothetical protein
MAAHLSVSSFSPPRRLIAIAVGLALAAAGAVGSSAPPADAHACSHRDHDHSSDEFGGKDFWGSLALNVGEVRGVAAA